MILPRQRQTRFLLFRALRRYNPQSRRLGGLHGSDDACVVGQRIAFIKIESNEVWNEHTVLDYRILRMPCCNEGKCMDALEYESSRA